MNRRLNDFFYQVACSGLFQKMADREAAHIVADPATAARVAEQNAILKEIADNLSSRLETLRTGARQATSENRGHATLDINIPVPYEAFDRKSPSPDMDAGLAELLKACQKENASIAASRKSAGDGFYLRIDPRQNFRGLSWAKPSFGMRLDF